MKPTGRAVDVRIYSDARTTGGGVAAVALLPGQGAEFRAPPKSAARKASTDSLVETNETFGFETFAMVAAVAAWGEQSRGEEMIRFVDNDAAAGAHIKAPPPDQAPSSFKKKVLGMRSAALGITPGRTRFVRGAPSG